MNVTPPNGRPSRRVRTGASSDDVTQSWTAQRCLRLLRPIHVSLNKLRQINEEAAFTGQDLKGRTVGGKRRKNILEEDEAYDPSKPKRARVTYSQRKRQADAGNDGGKSRAQFKVPSAVSRAPKTPGKLFMSTPIVRRIRGISHEVSSLNLRLIPSWCQNGDTVSTTQDTGRRPRGRPPKSLQTTPVATQSQSTLQLDQERQYDALIKALDALFHHAANQTNRRPTNPRSFVAMCLRQVPHQLKRIEEWDAAEAERHGEKSAINTQDAAQEIYDQMEGFSGIASGWGPLRHMVRAHAMSVICDAVTEELLDFAVVKRIISTCVQRECLHEATTLLVSMMEHQYPLAETQQDVPPPQPKVIEPLEYFITFCKRHNLWSVLFEKLTRLISENRISGEWLCIKVFEPVWAGLSEKFVVDGAACTRTLEFFHVAIWSLVSSLSTAQEEDETKTSSRRTPAQMFTSIVAAVTAMAIMSGSVGANDGSRAPETKDGISRAVLCALGGSLARLEVERRRARSMVSRLVLEFGIYMVTAGLGDNTSCADSREVEAAIEAPANKSSKVVNKSLYESATSLLCSVAQHCSRGSGSPAHEHLTTICKSLAGLTVAQRDITDLRREAAFLLAQRTGDLRDLAYAEAMMSDMDTCTRRSTSSGRAAEPLGDRESSDPTVTSLYSGWKWDEGISEWILRTPLPAQTGKAPTGRAQAESPTSRRRPQARVITVQTRIATRSRNNTRTRTRTSISDSLLLATDSSDDEIAMPPIQRRTGRPPLAPKADGRNAKVAAVAAAGMPAAGEKLEARLRGVRSGSAGPIVRRKVVRRISSWAHLGSSDDELLF